MKTEKTQHNFSHVFNKEVAENMSESVQAVEDSKFFDPSVYTSDDWFNFEIESIYKRNWLALGLSLIHI